MWLRTIVTDVRERLIAHIAGCVGKRGLLGRRHARDEDLENLIALGASGMAGHEKSVSLTWIDKVAKRTIAAPSYSGADLSVIIHGVEEIVTDTERRGSDANFLEGIEVLRSCWITLRTRGLMKSSDAGALIETLCVLGEAALPSCTDIVALACMDVAPDHGQIPFRIGAAALRHSRDRVAIAALSRLGALAVNDSFQRELIGLLALFSSSGSSAAAVARTIVIERHAWSVDEVRRAATNAATQFVEIGEFKMGDQVTAYASTCE